MNAMEFTSGRSFFLVNGETNLQITGRTKTELLRELQESGELGMKRLKRGTKTRKKGDLVPYTTSDITHRDYWTTRQLAAANLAEMEIAEKFAVEYESGELNNNEDLLGSQRNSVKQLFTEEALEKFRSDKRPKKYTLQKAKRDVQQAALPAPEKKRHKFIEEMEKPKKKRKYVKKKKQQNTLYKYYGSKV